jgi:hypothetical protein
MFGKKDDRTIENAVTQRRIGEQELTVEVDG